MAKEPHMLWQLLYTSDVEAVRVVIRFLAQNKNLFNINNYNEETIKRYNKPQKWPEPPTISDVSVLDDSDQAVFS